MNRQLWSIVVIAAALLAGCGQKGALIRPGQPTKAPVPVTAPTADGSQP